MEHNSKLSFTIRNYRLLLFMNSIVKRQKNKNKMKGRLDSIPPFYLCKEAEEAGGNGFIMYNSILSTATAPAFP